MHIRRKRKKIYHWKLYGRKLLYFSVETEKVQFFRSDISENRQFRSNFRISVYECQRERINRIEEEIFLIKRLDSRDKNYIILDSIMNISEEISSDTALGNRSFDTFLHIGILSQSCIVSSSI